MNLFGHLENYPPCLIRLLARRKSGRPLSTGEIANASLTPKTRLSTFEAESIAQQTDWRGVDIYQIQAFLQGCNCDLSNTKELHRIKCYLQSQPTFRYLRADDQWKPYYLPLLKKWAGSYINQTNVTPPIRALLARFKPILK